MAGQKKLPVLSGSKLCKILSKEGFYHVGGKGDHVKLKKDLNPQGKIIVIIPLYPKLSRKLLNQIRKEIGLTRDEFLELLNK